MKHFLDFIKNVRDAATPKHDRTGTGTLSIFGHQMRFVVTRGKPSCRLKRIW
ncbi:thymidylate synthase, partial [Enterobacter sp. APAP_BS8]|uniref:thymidylate synthase n=1 Tax=Enterobacter sp. APAP_BS8 TaxID=3070685 RepID=UPI002FD64CA9